MLYEAVEAQLLGLAPAGVAARCINQFLTHPLLPHSYMTASRATAAMFEMFDRATSHKRKPSFGLARALVGGETVAVRERPVVKRPFARLIHFEREYLIERHDPKVLVVAPMSGHHATLLRGTVEALLPEHEVYLVDWLDARQVPLSNGGFDLDDYVGYLIDFMTLLGPDLHVMAVCQPSPPVLAATALLSEAGQGRAPRSMTLMGGPVDTRINPTAVNRVAMENSLSWFESKAVHSVPAIYPGAMRRVYPGFLQLGGFMSMNPDRHMASHLDFFHHLVEGDGESAAAHRRFYDEYLSVMDLSADFYLDTIRHVFQEHSLPRGEMRYRGHRIDLSAIENTALMTIEGELDDISGVGQTKAAHVLCPRISSDRRRHLEQPGVGHYGIFNGRKWRQSICPSWAEFIRSLPQ